MNGYDLHRMRLNFRFENPDKCRSIHSELFMYIVDLRNRLGQKEKFGLPTQMTMEFLGIGSYNTYNQAYKDLVEWGFIKEIKKSINQYSARVITISKSDKATDKALDKASIKATDIIDNNITKNNIIVEGTTNSEVDECIKKQIRELGFPRQGEDAAKYKILVELVAMGLSCEKTDKAILSRVADIEKKLDANGYYTSDYLGAKTYNYQIGWNVATNLRERQANQGKPSGNVLNSYARFLSNNKKK